MKLENPYRYTEADLETITNERIALCHGWQEGFDAAVKWYNEPDAPQEPCPDCGGSGCRYNYLGLVAYHH